jgi:hypothetical protein
LVDRNIVGCAIDHRPLAGGNHRSIVTAERAAEGSQEKEAAEGCAGGSRPPFPTVAPHIPFVGVHALGDNATWLPERHSENEADEHANQVVQFILSGTVIR